VFYDFGELFSFPFLFRLCVWISPGIQSTSNLGAVLNNLSVNIPPIEFY